MNRNEVYFNVINSLNAQGEVHVFEHGEAIRTNIAGYSFRVERVDTGVYRMRVSTSTELPELFVNVCFSLFPPVTELPCAMEWTFESTIKLVRTFVRVANLARAFNWRTSTGS